MRYVRQIGGLELISHIPDSNRRAPAFLFVHGAYAAAWCWDDYFLPHFAQHGYCAHAVSLRGHGGSAGRQALAHAGIDDFEADVLAAAREIGGPLVVVGHSMGATVVQRCLHGLPAAAAVLMAPIPPEGLVGPSLLLAARDPALFGEINLAQHAHPGFATAAGLRRALFSSRVSEADVHRHYARMQSESHRAVFDLSWPQHLWIGRTNGAAVRVLGAQEDAFFPPPMIESTARFYGVVPVILPHMGHAMMLEPDWKDAADDIIRWRIEIGA